MGQPCATVPEFRTDAGQLVVMGPAPLDYDRTCVSGQACGFGGIHGRDLSSGNTSSGNTVMVLDTCSGGYVPTRFASTGLVSSVSSTGASVSWGVVPVTAAGGEYRLCWCAGAGFSCSVQNDYYTDFGRLNLIWLSPLYQDKTCAS